MVKIEAYLDIAPPHATAQQKGVRVVYGKPMFYEKAKVKNARQIFKDALKPYVPRMPIENPVRLSVGWYFPIKDKKRWGKWKTTRPDTDNLEKLLKDVMTEMGFWADDSLVVWETVQKRTESRGAVVVYVEELEE